MIQFPIPPRSKYDLNFRIVGIPVRINPWFWLTTILLAVGMDPNLTPQLTLIWVVAMFVSVLLHELGHAAAIRYYQWTPRIILHGLGGLAVYDAKEKLGYDPVLVLGRENLWRINSVRQQVAISLAGPIIGFIAAGIVFALVMLIAGPVHFYVALPNLTFWQLPNTIPNANLYIFLEYFLFINIFWGLTNLLPILPLDGGQVLKDILVSKDGYRAWLRVTLVGFVTSCIMGAACIVFWFSLMALLFFGGLGFLNFRMYRQLKQFGEVGGFADESRDDSDADDGDWWKK